MNVCCKRFLNISIAHYNSIKVEDAITKYEQAVQIADETHRNDIKAKAYQHLGNICTGTSEYKRAIEYYKKAREIFPDLEADDLEIEAYQWLLETFDNVERGDIERKYENILDEERISAEQLLALGRFCQNNGKIEDAIINYERAVQIADETHRTDIKAKAYQHLGSLFCGTSEYKKAIKYYKKAQNTSPDLEADDLEEDTYQWLVETVDNVERVDIEHKYVNVYEETISVEQLLVLGRFCQNNGKIEEAITTYEQVVQIAHDTHRNDIKAKAYQHLEDVFCQMFEYKKAIEYCKKADEISSYLEADRLAIEPYQTVHNVEVDIEQNCESILDDHEERISEQQSSILGRSCQNNGKIEEANTSNKLLKLRMKPNGMKSKQKPINIWKIYVLELLKIRK